MGQSIQDRYYALLKAYALTSEEECLAATAELGRELVLANVPPEEIAMAWPSVRGSKLSSDRSGNCGRAGRRRGLS